MTNYKLYYFNVTGLAEPIRYLLHYCQIEFEDIRFKDFEEWKAKYKNKMPMNQVPVLEINGIHHHQHLSICRYIGKKFDLCGSSEEESLEIDAIVDDINDLRIEMGRYFKEEDETIKAILHKRMMEKLPFFFNNFESKVSKNNGFFFKGKITWSDIYYTAISELMSNIVKGDVHEEYPNLKKLTENIRRNKNIKDYLERRPKTIL